MISLCAMQEPEIGALLSECGPLRVHQVSLSCSNPGLYQAQKVSLERKALYVHSCKAPSSRDGAEARGSSGFEMIVVRFRFEDKMFHWIPNKHFNFQDVHVRLQSCQALSSSGVAGQNPCINGMPKTSQTCTLADTPNVSGTCYEFSQVQMLYIL